MTTPNDDLSKLVWNDLPSKNGYADDIQYREHIIEQYKLYVEMADRISSRRDTANTFFLTLNGLSLGAAGALIDKGYTLTPPWALLFPLTVLLLECFFWWRLILSYKNLNGAKFAIVGELEKRLPASPYQKAEWHILGEGKNRKIYWPITHIESWIPLVFIVGYVIAAIALWCKS